MSDEIRYGPTTQQRAQNPLLNSANGRSELASATGSAKRRVDQSWFNAKSVEYETPDGIYKPLDGEFHFTLDVAATPNNAKCKRYYTKETDGLKQSWQGEMCWMNPPYGRVMQKWVRKAHAEWKRGCGVVALIPARTNTGWWHECVEKQATVRFIRGEVAFKGFERGLWMPMCIVIWPNYRTELRLPGSAATTTPKI